MTPRARMLAQRKAQQSYMVHTGAVARHCNFTTSCAHQLGTQVTLSGIKLRLSRIVIQGFVILNIGRVKVAKELPMLLTTYRDL